MNDPATILDVVLISATIIAIMLWLLVGIAVLANWAIKRGNDES